VIAVVLLVCALIVGVPTLVGATLLGSVILLALLAIVDLFDSAMARLHRYRYAPLLPFVGFLWAGVLYDLG
jgi:hypothetical protein